MAKGIDILGTLRGKRGGVVYYRSGGAQLSRPRVTPRNPKSAKQAVQRMVLASAAKLAGALSPIVNHSFEGVQHGNASINHFRKGVMTQLRGAAAAYFGGGSAGACGFVLKGAPAIAYVPGAVISRGSLQMNSVFLDASQNVCIAGTSALTEPLTSQGVYESVLASIGLVPGDQITLVLIHKYANTPVAQIMVNGYPHQNFAGGATFARVTFKSQLPSDFDGTLIDTETHSFNADLVESVEGSMPDVATTGTNNQDLVFITDTIHSVVLSAVIRSQKQENGKFKYSTSTLLTSEELLDDNDAWPTYLSYMEGTQIEVGDNLYLQNATN